MSADAWALEPEAGGSAGVPGQPGLQRTLEKSKGPGQMVQWGKHINCQVS